MNMRVVTGIPSPEDKTFNEKKFFITYIKKVERIKFVVDLRLLNDLFSYQPVNYEDSFKYTCVIKRSYEKELFINVN